MAATAQNEALLHDEPAETHAVYAVRHDVMRPALPALALKMLGLFDGKRTLAEVCAESELPFSKGVAVVRRLCALGLLSAAAPRTSVSEGFSAEEEAFFASEVLPFDEGDEPAVTLRDRMDLFLAGLLGRQSGAPLRAAAPARLVR